MTDRPILRLANGRVARRGAGQPDRRPRPRSQGAVGQGRRLGAQFDRLEAALAEEDPDVVLRRDPGGIAPERALVFVTAVPIANFVRAARLVGLEVLAELDLDDDYALDEELIVEHRDMVSPTLYATMPARDSFETLLRLWRAYQQGERPDDWCFPGKEPPALAPNEGSRKAPRKAGAGVSRRKETGRPALPAILAKRPDHSPGIVVDDGQQHTRGPVGSAAALFPLLNRARIEPEALRELLPAQPQPLAQGNDPFGGWIVDYPTSQARLAANMVENLAQRRFDLLPERASFTIHCPVSFLIAATRRESARTSAAVRSFRSAFA